MHSVPELRAELSAHPAALEQEAVERSPLRGGVRPQWAALLPVPSRPVRVPSHNARVRGYLAYRQTQLAAQGQRVIVAEPERMAFRALLGARHVPHTADLRGYALNLEYVYQSPRGGEYVITGYVWGFGDGPLTGDGYARSCTCPDFQKRRGPARDQVHGEERCCKHMRLFLAIAHLWQGQWPWIGGIPTSHLLPGEGFILREF